jgi:RHS repeat-associated protein
LCVGCGKRITGIEYNYLNLPIRITFTNNRKIDIIYDATGKKWRKVVNDNGAETYRDYIEGAEYQNGQQDIIHFTEGYAQRDATTDGDANWKGWVYKYTLKDHLGNTRVTYSDKNNDGIVGVSDIEQVNHYYASGLNMEGSWNGANGAFKYGYNSKEWNDDFGLGWNDYGARFYDPAVFRWLSPDPLAESYFRWSPYNYAKDNPIRNIDPDGMRVSLFDEARMKNGIDVGAEKKAESDKIDASIGIGELVGKAEANGGTWSSGEDGNKNNEDEPTWVRELMNPDYSEDEGSIAAYVIPRAIPVAAIDGPAPIADGVVGVVAAVALATDLALRRFITYEVYNPIINQYYVGRASGFGSSEEVFKRRFASHKFKDFIAKNGGRFSIDQTIQSVPAGYWAIRGREQQLYDYHKNLGHILANISRPVWYYNPNAYFYHVMSNVAFGEIARYTGYINSKP